MIDANGRTTLVQELTPVGERWKWQVPKVTRGDIVMIVLSVLVGVFFSNIGGMLAPLWSIAGIICYGIAAINGIVDFQKQKKIPTIRRAVAMKTIADRICDDYDLPPQQYLAGEVAAYANDKELLLAVTQIVLQRATAEVLEPKFCHAYAIRSAYAGRIQTLRLFLESFSVQSVLLERLKAAQAEYDPDPSLTMRGQYGVIDPSVAKVLTGRRMQGTEELLRVTEEALRNLAEKPDSVLDIRVHSLLLAASSLAYETPHDAKTFRRALTLMCGERNIDRPDSENGYKDMRSPSVILLRLIVAQRLGLDALRVREEEDAIKWLKENRTFIKDNYAFGGSDFFSGLCALKMTDLEKKSLEIMALSSDGLSPELQRRLIKLQKKINPNAVWLGDGAAWNASRLAFDIRSLKWSEQDVASVFDQICDAKGASGALRYGLALREEVETVALSAEYRNLVGNLRLSGEEYRRDILRGYGVADAKCEKGVFVLYGRDEVKQFKAYMLYVPLEDGSGMGLGCAFRISHDAQGYRLTQYALLFPLSAPSGPDRQESAAKRFISSGSPVEKAKVDELLKAAKKGVVKHIQHKLDELYFGGRQQGGAPQPQPPRPTQGNARRPAGGRSGGGKEYY